MTKRIYLSSPHMCGKELEYVHEAFATNWIAPLGKHVNQFEKEVAAYVGVQDAAALSSGTAAIHLALKWLGVTAGDEVFCSSLTFSGSCNPIIYEKAIPIFIDSEPESFNMSPIALERAFLHHKPKAVIVVNIYGQSADYDQIKQICAKYHTPIIEDAAESLGATYHGKQTGSFGDLSIVSFNGNKIITTSGGGMLLSNNSEAIQKARFWATQARDPERHYQHTELGYNYRMSNVCAGIGRGQLTALKERLSQKKYINQAYLQAFRNIADIELMPICDFGEPNYWLSVITIRNGHPLTPLEIILALEENNIEARPIWKPMHAQPFYQGYPFYAHDEKLISVADAVFNRGLCLPSDTKMTDDDIERVTRIVKKLFNK